MYNLFHFIVDVAMGPDHTVCLTEHGKAITIGRNIEAQLGKGHTHSGGGKPYLVKAMAEKEMIDKDESLRNEKKTEELMKQVQEKDCLLLETIENGEHDIEKLKIYFYVYFRVRNC